MIIGYLDPWGKGCKTFRMGAFRVDFVMSALGRAH